MRRNKKKPTYSFSLKAKQRKTHRGRKIIGASLLSVGGALIANGLAQKKRQQS